MSDILPTLEIDDYTGDNSPNSISQFPNTQITKFVNYVKDYSNQRIEYIISNDLHNRCKYELPMSKSIILLDSLSMKSIIYKCLTGNYVFLLCLDHGLGILVKKCNIKHCKMIANSFQIDDIEGGFSKPNMLLNTPIVDLSLYTNCMNSNKLLLIFNELITDKYYQYPKDDVSINFYKAIGFDFEKHISLDVDAYGSDDD